MMERGGVGESVWVSKTERSDRNRTSKCKQRWPHSTHSLSQIITSG